MRAVHQQEILRQANGISIQFGKKMTDSEPANLIDWALNKYGMFLLRKDKGERARKMFQALTLRHPDSLVGFDGLAKVAEQTGDHEEELEVWQRVYENFPAHSEGQMKYGELLRITTRYKEAEAHFQKLIQDDPGARKLQSALARTASSAREYDLAVARWQELTELYPNNDKFWRSLIRALIEILDFEQAQAIYDQHLTENPDIVYLLLQVDIYLAQSDTEQAFSTVSKLHSAHPDSRKILNRKLGLLNHLYRNTGNTDYGEQALKAMDVFELRNSISSSYQEKRVEISILLGRKDIALGQLSKLRPDHSQKNMELRAWGFSMTGNMEEAKSLWKDITRLYYPTRVRPPPAGSLQQTDSNSLELNKDSILLFTAVRNERWRLPWFLDYYRSLGVERFFFVDNNSTDGTTAFLLDQPDVHVFWTEQSYAQAYSGMQWINWLVGQYGSDCWCIYADVDEALVFPGGEKRGLRSLTNYMADHGQEAMYAFMLDMYAPHLNSVARDNDYMDFFSDYPLFENEYSTINTAYCPYRFTAGGIRRTFKLSENQTKTPIIRGGVGITFLMSSHQITPAHLSDVSGVLLHYKLAGDFTETFTNDLSDNSRIARCKMRHWRYIEALKDLPEDESFIHDSTVSYESSEQLVDLGILSTSSAFEGGSYD